MWSPTTGAQTAKKTKSTSKKASPSPDPANDDASVTSSSSTSSASSAEHASKTSKSPSPSASGSEGGSDGGREEPDAEQDPADFDAWYLRQLTAEFGDDLDKVRNANDFSDASLPVLIRALRECASGYGEEQKRKVMGQGGQ